MRIEYSPYTLAPVREGALLRVHFSADLIGYADCHPWPTLGDLPLSEQLASLIRQPTYLTKQALFFAHKDAVARRDHKSLFSDLILPENHFLILNLLSFSPAKLNAQIQAGYTHFKVKLGNNPLDIAQLQTLISHAPKEIRFRLDFNCKLTSTQFAEVIKQLKPQMESIEFIEDPFPYALSAWTACQSPIPLAVDRASLDALNSPFHLIVKPAIQSVPDHKILHKRSIIFTSYLDHPLGQMAAAVAAAEFYRTSKCSSAICGLKTWPVYALNAFSELLPGAGPFITPPPGTGYGFDEILQQLKWRPLP